MFREICLNIYMDLTNVTSTVKKFFKYTKKMIKKMIVSENCTN